ncbi:hypothetical protein L9F63_009433 [Diploptera punctata]|uniref:Uncharacterized protein n=1 Tax=Diploptera punctata TaxID=6984 RepID=A0AAD8AL84_DIPPU|nr:hypothetical protein L9F63_009433 [Diploptera punctata]
MLQMSILVHLTMADDTLLHMENMLECTNKVYTNTFHEGSRILVSLPTMRELKTLEEFPNKPPFHNLGRLPSWCIKQNTESDKNIYQYQRCAIDLLIGVFSSIPSMQWVLKPPNRGIFFSHIQDKIMKNIQESQKSPIILTGKMSLSQLTFYDLDGILLVCLGEDLELSRISDVMRNMSARNFKIIFVILGKTKLLKDLYQFFHSYSFYKFSVIIQNYINGNFELLTWKYDSCGNLLTSPIMHSCNNEESFHNWSISFPEIPKKFKQCNLTIVLKYNPPFILEKFHSDPKDGIDIQLIYIIASHLGLVVKFDANLRGIIDFLQDIKYTITYMERYYTEEYAWYVPRASSHPRVSNLTRVFSSNVWVTVVLALLFLALILNHLWFTSTKNILKCILTIFGIFLNVSSSNVPNTGKFRAVFLSWIVFSIAVTTIFQAFMTSYMTDPGREHQIDSYQELEDSELKLFIDEIKRQHWPRFLGNKGGYYISKDGVTSTIQLAMNTSKVAMILSKEVFLYNFPKENKTNWKTILHRFSKESVGIHRSLPLAVTSPYVPLVNEVVRRLVEGGIVDKLVQRAVEVMTSRESLLDEFEVLTLFHMFSSFLYLSVGLVFSFIVFCVEILAFTCKIH